MSNPPQSQHPGYSRSMFYGHSAAQPHSYANYGAYPQMQRQQSQQMPQMHGQSRSNPARGQSVYSTLNNNTSLNTSCAPSMRLPSMCQSSISQPPPIQTTQRHSQSGIVLQSLSQAKQAQQMASVGGSLQCGYGMDSSSMAQTLAQYAQYTQPQLQQVMAQYPPWFQKELMRRLQRQYEEMYVVEDPKIHHWSAICPRDTDTDTLNEQLTDNDKKKVLPAVPALPQPKSNQSQMAMASPASACGRSSCHFLSPSLSAGPNFDGGLAYSPHHQTEATSSPPPEHPSLDPLDSEQAPSSQSSLKSPRTPRALCSDAVSLQPQTKTASRATCFQILDVIGTDNELSAHSNAVDDAKNEVEEQSASPQPESTADSPSKAQHQTQQPQVQSQKPMQTDAQTLMGGQTQMQSQAQAQTQSAAVYEAQKYQNYQQAMQRWYAQQQQQQQQQQQAQMQQYQQQLQFQQQRQQQQQHHQHQHQHQQQRQYAQQMQVYRAQMARYKEQKAYYAQQTQQAQQMEYMYNRGRPASTQARFCA